MGFSASSSLPAGVILMWHGLIANIPIGFVLCDGGAGTPDLRSKFARGAPAATEAGGVGGADTHTLTVAELAAHTHVINFSNNATTGTGSPMGSVADNPASSRASGSVGSDTAHNNMPAYYQVLFIMKT